MARRVQWRREESDFNDTFTGALAEITVDTDTGGLRVHNGATPGGAAVGTEINVKWFASVADAISAALAAKAGLFFPPGVHDVNPVGVALDFTNVREIRGVPGASIIKLAAGATGDADGRLVVFDNTNAHWNGLTAYGLAAIQKVSGLIFDFDAVTATSRIGVTLGAYASLVAEGTAFRLVMEECEIARMDTTDSYGLHIKDVVQCALTRTVVRQNFHNVLIGGEAGTSLPTTVSLAQCNIKEATERGLTITQVLGLTVDHQTVIENNGEHAIVIQPGTGQEVESLDLRGLWTESNWLVDVADPGTRATKYAVLIDGTAAAVYDVGITRCRLSEVAKVLDANNVIGLVIDAPDRPAALTGDFNIRNANSIVHLVNWPAALAVGPGPGVTIANPDAALIYFEGALYKSVAMNFGSVGNAAQATAGFTMTGVQFGWNVSVAASVSLQGQQFTASCNAADTATVVLQNNTGGAIDLGAFTAWVRAYR